jgi:ABC-type multidrug transport system fused ATPase/permease subunit
MPPISVNLRKPKNAKLTIKKISKFYLTYKKGMFFAILTTIFSAIFYCLFPIILNEMIKKSVTNIDGNKYEVNQHNLLLYGILILSVCFIAIVCDFIKTLLITKITQKIS